MVKVPARFKRVAAAFDVAARECDSSSGSDHSPDLSGLVESFIEREGKLAMEIAGEVSNKAEKGGKKKEDNSDSSDDEDDDCEGSKDRLRRLLGGDEREDGDGGGGGERRRIMKEVEVARRLIIGEEKDKDFKRKLMTYLRTKGFDAGLCKSRWDKCGNCPAGSYEYIDVKTRNHRYIIELNLAGEFEIARPTTQYLTLLTLFPPIFVGKAEELKQAVRLMCNEMQLSMKSVGMHLPPWRRDAYMQAKWLSGYKRTVKEEAAGSRVNNKEVKRKVGFEEMGGSVVLYCREEFVRLDGFRVGRLTAMFNGGGI